MPWGPLPSYQLLSRLLWLVPLLFLWQSLIRHLSIEWSLNPQYAFGWAVPFLCVYLAWRDVRSRRRDVDEQSTRAPLLGFKRVGLGLILALCYAGTRLVQEANPEWRLVSWGLSIEVIGLTWLVLPFVFSFGHSAASPRARFSLFALLFFLVAVPWPTLIERPIMRGLTTSTARATVEALGVFGVPALLHGNLIETDSGLIGIDEACSGIRSFQASLMIALFFGEVYRLGAPRRLLCVVAAFSLSVLFNVVRTTLLALISAKEGSVALSDWHDPAGLWILSACFISIWFLAFYLRPSTFQTLVRPKAFSLLVFPFYSKSVLRFEQCLCWSLIGWIAFVELGTDLWYRRHERNSAHAVRWHPIPVDESAEWRDLGFSETSRRFLRFDEGLNISWRERDGLRWQAIFLKWAPGRVATYLARNHTPRECLTASGRPVLSESGLFVIPVNELNLPFRHYVVHEETGPLHVYYCLWEDRDAEQSFGPVWLSYRNRFRPVLDGRRNCGQRSLELAVWGCANDQQAEEAFRRLTPRLIQVEK